MVEILERRGRFATQRLIDEGETSGLNRKAVTGLVYQMRRLGLLCTIGRKMVDIEITTFGRQWLEAIPAESAGA